MIHSNINTPGLSVQHLSMKYGDRLALDDISFQVPLKTVLAIIGPSGAGKTTLLRCIAAIEHHESGQIIFNDPTNPMMHYGRSTPAKSHEFKGIGMVFQGLNLWPHLTVLENITYGLVKVKEMGQKDASDVAIHALDSIGLVDKVSCYPDSLSGGEAQRVAIVRALVMKPLLLLLDEITSALDVERTWEVLSLVQRLAQEGMTMVIVTHELGFARKVATQLAFMDNGKLVECGPTEEIFQSPKSARTRQFLSHSLT